jgi:hypothetical protein
MAQFKTTFTPSECRCYVPLAILGLLPLLALVFLLVARSLAI